MSTPITSTGYCTGDSSQCNQVRKRKVIQIGKQEVQLYLQMTRTDGLSSITGYQTSVKNSTASLDISNEQFENKITKTI